MQIRLAKENDIVSISDIGYAAFCKEEYYSGLLAKKNGATKLREIFRKSAEICVEHGIAITAHEDGKTVGFMLAFDYFHLKECHSDEFAHFFSHTDKNLNAKLKDAQMHIEAAMGTSRDYIYLLSIGVDENYRGQGIATNMTQQIVKAYSHYGVITDSSSSISATICRNMGFDRVDSADGVEILIRKGTDLPYGEYREKSINVALPLDTKGYNTTAETLIEGVESDNNAFRIAIGKTLRVKVVSMSYEELLRYQRDITPINYAEKKGLIEDIEYIYYVRDESDARVYCKSDYPDKQDEWNIITDVVTCVPVVCVGDKKYQCESLKEKNPFYINRFLSALDYRSEYESGVPLDDMGFENYKKRIKRYGLEKVLLQIKNEPDYNFSKGSAVNTNLGYPIEVGLMLSIDTASDIGVLSIVQMSSGFLLTQYLDCVSRNQLTVLTKNGEKNLYSYLREKYDIKKIGEAKSFVTSFTKKEEIRKDLMASMMFCETHYAQKEGLGKVVDEDIITMLTKKTSLAQYDYADVYIGSHILLQCLNDYRGCLDDRVLNESVTLFYVELVCFEEAAIAYASQNIISYLATIEVRSPNSTLRRYYRMLSEYAKTVDFWDVQMNYASSKKSVDNIRLGFGIDELLNRYNRNQKILRQVYESRRDYIDRIEAGLLTALGAIITVISIVDMAISPNKWVMLSVATGIIGVLLILKSVLFKRVLRRWRKK